MLPPCFYRVSTKALITKENKVLLIMESDGTWELPGGGLEVGETFEIGLKREISEEIGVNITNRSSQPLYVWTLVVEDQKGITPKVILVFKTDVDSYDFKGNAEESSKAGFFSIEEMNNLNLHPNIKELPKVLNVRDLNNN